MALIKCPAEICIHNFNGMCEADAVEMTDFEYYEDYEGKRRDILEDDMKCNTYQSKNKN
ncbi:DUF1540 domain-containing protein [Clostridium beijerinckii]|uniref:DUF1540 domain-containing protein n=1 Tax=Clostridium beijerinckii TaxID=1520 RepID=UPI002330EC82|nr:DUF1540 domain-containing protein [Clostridium beijerinckii]